MAKPMDRRAVVLGPTALAASAALLPSVTRAAPAALAAAPTAAMTWATIGAEGLGQLVGQRFRARTADGTALALRLVAVEAVRSGPDRPAALPRAEGVIAVFGGPDAALLPEARQWQLSVSHPRLGSASLLAGPGGADTGSRLVEVVLN